MIFIKFRLELKKSLCFSVFFSVLFYKGPQFFLAYLAAVIHEFAHGLAAYMLGIKPQGVICGILGARLDLPHVIGFKHKLIIYFAGPVMNFFVFICFLVGQKIFSINSVMYSFFIFANFAIGIINLLPIFPLDGGIILRTVLGAYSGIINGAKRCRTVSDIFIVFLSFLGMLMSAGGKFNPSVAGLLIFLVFNRRNEKCCVIAEKKTVLSGDVVPGKRHRYIACDAESELLCLARYISYEYTLVVAAFYNEKFLCDLNQDDIIKGIKTCGALCTIRDYVNLPGE